MRGFISVLTGAAVLGLGQGLDAQDRAPAPRREPAPMRILGPDGEGCVTTGGNTECRIVRIGTDSGMMKRPAIGVQLSPTGTVRDTLGVFISRVTPKGPAENAGIIEGERIVSINGVDLRVNAADAGDAYAAQLPSRRLNREVAKLTPGATANLRVHSGGRTRDVRVTVARASDLGPASSSGFGMGMGPLVMMRRGPELDALRLRLHEMPPSLDVPARFRIERDGNRIIERELKVEAEKKVETEKKETKKKQ